MELGEQHATGEDHDRTQHDRAQDADDEHLLPLFFRHREVAHDHQEHEDVVHRQGLLDQITGEELQADLVGHHLAGGLVEVVPKATVEGQGEQHPADRPPQRLLEGDLVGPAVPHQYEIDQQRDDYHRAEAAPQPQISDRLHGFVRWINEMPQAGRRGSATEDRGDPGTELRHTAKVSLAAPMGGTAVAPEPAGSN